VTINRDNLIQQIRALMNKTVTNGCTEPEALAALDKARAMMDAYEVTEDRSATDQGRVGNPPQRTAGLA
jgi:hypothetical protein